MIVAGSASPLLLSSAGGYNLTKSLRFRSSASAYLNRTLGVSGSGTTWTFSTWVKRGKLGVLQKILGTSYTSTSEFYLFFNSSDQIQYGSYTAGGASNNFSLITTQVFRDPSAWYQIVFVWDTTQATSSDRVKMYVNGVQVTAFGTATYPTLNYSGIWNNSSWTHYIGADASSSYYDGYLAEVNFVDGQALTPSSFGETSTSTGVWIPKKYTGTYGTNGFYLPFTDTTSTSTLGTDFSGNSNTWTVNNISLTSGSTYDSMNDVPTLTSATTANYATINPLDYNSTYLTLDNGNLHQTYAGVVAAAASRATMVIPTTGKFYWEVYINATGGGSGERIRAGITRPTTAISGNSIDGSATSYLQMSNGQKRNNSTDSTYGSGFSAGQYIQVLYDATAGAIYFGQNGSYANGTGSFNQAFSGAVAAFTSLSGEFMPCFITYGGADIAVNFGQQPFAYTPPTGFVALNTFNLPAPPSGIGTTAATTANKYFDATLYTGNSSTQTVTNSGSMQPDWVWIKDRSAVGQHVLTDSVGGVDKQLFSSLTNAEQTSATAITSFNSNGFTTGANPSPTGATNSSPDAFVAWQWRASNATAVTNTAGSITSTVSASTTAGFSIVTYTGTGANATVGHGLGVAPSMVIVKRRPTAGSNFPVWHTGIANTEYLMLNSTNAKTTGLAWWNSTSPTSTVFSVGSDPDTNGTVAIVAYCFAPVAGYSAFGSYTGNGSSDGPFVYTGFRPRFIMWKRSDSTGDWIIFDTARDTYNYADKQLVPNTSGAEQVTGGGFVREDFLSNGFKVRSTDSYINANGGTYIYMAFCESPFKFSNAR